MNLKEKPHYTLKADTLADWLDHQSDKWWVVDGDPALTSVVDFPCPSDELASAIRRAGSDLILQDKDPESAANGEVVSVEQLDALSDVSDRHHQRTYRLSWIDSDIDWLLTEDKSSES